MNKADKLRMERIHAMPCVCCWMLRVIPLCGKTEAHHIVDGGYRRLSGGHQSSLPLGAFHHRGEPPEGLTISQATAFYGPSLALQKRAFIQKFGTERELLAIVNERIGATA
jgi:hypothetical protein